MTKSVIKLTNIQDESSKLIATQGGIRKSLCIWNPAMVFFT